MAKKRVGEVLREMREENGISARDLERASGLTTGEISQIETGRRADPAFGVILRFARGLGVSLDEVARRVEGGAKSSADSDGRSRAKASSVIEKAKAQHAKLGEMLDSVSDALSTRKKK